MTDESVNDASLRQFLLGNVNETERERIETLFITDRLDRDRVFLAEEDLVEDYLEDSLTASDRDSFLALYGNNDTQRQKLLIAKTIRNWAISENKARTESAAAGSTWSRLFTKLRAKPMFVVPLTAAALVFVIVAAFWLYSRTQEKNRFLALEQEVAQLNTVNSHDVTAQMSLSLRPGAVRSVQQQTTLELQTGTQLVELRLLWNQRESYPRYQAILSKVDNQSLTIRDLFLEKDSQMVNLKLPSHILTPGSYEVQLTGIAADGSTGPTEEYEFTVSR